MVSYILKGTARNDSLPEKVRVFQFPVRRVLAHLDATANLCLSASRTVLLPLVITMLSVIWPARPHTLLSCLTADVKFSDNYAFFTPTSHKRKPLSYVFKVKLERPNWLAVVSRFVELTRVLKYEFLFSLSGPEPTRVVYEDAFRKNVLS